MYHTCTIGALSTPNECIQHYGCPKCSICAARYYNTNINILTERVIVNVLYWIR